MAGKRIDRIITHVRRATDNEDVSSTVGISDEEFLQYANDSLRDLQRLAIQHDVSLFRSSTEISIAAGTREYTLPANVYTSHGIDLVEYSFDGQARNYIPLRRIYLVESSNSEVTYPCFYMLQNDKILVSPIPISATGTLRITYVTKSTLVDKRRGTITARTISGDDYTTITVSSPDETELALAEYVTVVDYDGTVKYSAIPVSSYDAGTDTLTLRSGVATSSGTITVGDYIVSGKYASTHFPIPDWEDYHIAYITWKILKRDSSTDAVSQESELVAIRNSIEETLKSLPADLISWPIINEEYL